MRLHQDGGVKAPGMLLDVCVPQIEICIKEAAAVLHVGPSRTGVLQ